VKIADFSENNPLSESWILSDILDTLGLTTDISGLNRDIIILNKLSIS
jgi:hypothetical protein